MAQSFGGFVFALTHATHITQFFLEHVVVRRLIYQLCSNLRDRAVDDYIIYCCSLADYFAIHFQNTCLRTGLAMANKAGNSTELVIARAWFSSSPLQKTICRPPSSSSANFISVNPTKIANRSTMSLQCPHLAIIVDKFDLFEQSFSTNQYTSGPKNGIIIGNVILLFQR